MILELVEAALVWRASGVVVRVTKMLTNFKVTMSATLRKVEL